MLMNLLVILLLFPLDLSIHILCCAWVLCLRYLQSPTCTPICSKYFYNENKPLQWTCPCWMSFLVVHMRFERIKKARNTYMIFRILPSKKWSGTKSSWIVVGFQNFTRACLKCLAQGLPAFYFWTFPHLCFMHESAPFFVLILPSPPSHLTTHWYTP